MMPFVYGYYILAQLAGAPEIMKSTLMVACCIVMSRPEDSIQRARARTIIVFGLGAIWSGVGMHSLGTPPHMIGLWEVGFMAIGVVDQWLFEQSLTSNDQQEK